MREVMQRSGDHEVALVDGVKVLFDDRWVLVLPDPAEALTHVWAEGPTDLDSRRLAQEWAQRIRVSLR
jgi:mannose-1-phosphate guanylyltransferase/phosphomannomutase